MGLISSRDKGDLSLFIGGTHCWNKISDKAERKVTQWNIVLPRIVRRKQLLLACRFLDHLRQEGWKCAHGFWRSWVLGCRPSSPAPAWRTSRSWLFRSFDSWVPLAGHECPCLSEKDSKGSLRSNTKAVGVYWVSLMSVRQLLSVEREEIRRCEGRRLLLVHRWVVDLRWVGVSWIHARHRCGLSVGSEQWHLVVVLKINTSKNLPCNLWTELLPSSVTYWIIAGTWWYVFVFTRVYTQKVPNGLWSSNHLQLVLQFYPQTGCYT